MPQGADDASGPSLGVPVRDLLRPGTNTKSEVLRPHLDAVDAKMCKVVPLRPPRPFGLDPRGACGLRRGVGMDGAC